MEKSSGQICSVGIPRYMSCKVKDENMRFIFVQRATDNNNKITALSFRVPNMPQE